MDKLWHAIPCKIIILLSFLVLPQLVLADCTCEPESQQHNKTEALKYKLAAIASILVASALGVSLPIFGKAISSALRPETSTFIVVKAFAGGVILSTGFVHILPEAFESLTSPCLSDDPWAKFPFAGFITMLASVGTLVVDTYVSSFFSKRPKEQEAISKHDQEKGGGENDHHVSQRVHASEEVALAQGSMSPVHESASMGISRLKVISQVLELGIVVHSVIIGISLGVSNNPGTARALMAALTFHQFFEGIGLAGCIAMAKFKGATVAIMALVFSLTTPVGVALGIGISNIYVENSPNALMTEGILEAAAAGVLIYTALMNLLAADLTNPKVQSSGKLRIWTNTSLLLGIGSMSVIAKWA